MKQRISSLDRDSVYVGNNAAMSSRQAVQSHAKLIISDYAISITCVVSDINAS